MDLQQQRIHTMQQQIEYTPYTTVIISGDLVEVIQYEKSLPKSKGKPVRPSATRLISKQEPEDHDLTYQMQSYYRARKNIKRLYHCNFSNKPSVFITLTFDDKHVEKFTDIKEYKAAFNNFLKRVSRRHPGFKHLTVPEFHLNADRDKVHFHMLSNLTNISKTDLTKIWGWGFVDIQPIRDDTETSDKLSQYLCKGALDPRLRGLSRYHKSRDLKEPMTFHDASAEEMIELLSLEKQQLYYSDSYDSAYRGTVISEEYRMSSKILVH